MYCRCKMLGDIADNENGFKIQAMKSLKYTVWIALQIRGLENNEKCL